MWNKLEEELCQQIYISQLLQTDRLEQSAAVQTHTDCQQRSLVFLVIIGCEGTGWVVHWKRTGTALLSSDVRSGHGLFELQFYDVQF